MTGFISGGAGGVVVVEVTGGVWMGCAGGVCVDVAGGVLAVCAGGVGVLGVTIDAPETAALSASALASVVRISAVQAA